MIRCDCRQRQLRRGDTCIITRDPTPHRGGGNVTGMMAVYRFPVAAGEHVITRRGERIHIDDANVCIVQLITRGLTLAVYADSLQRPATITETNTPEARQDD